MDISCCPARWLLFEAANPRHAHEWAVFEEIGVITYMKLAAMAEGARLASDRLWGR